MLTQPVALPHKRKRKRRWGTSLAGSAYAGRTQPVSLSQLSSSSVDYEKMPMELSQEAQKNVWQALGVNTFAITLLAVLPTFLTSIASSAFFAPLGLFDWPAEFMWEIGSFLRLMAAVLIPAAVGSLLAIFYVLYVSANMQMPVDEYVHWVTFAVTVPAGVSAVTIAIGAVAASVLAICTLAIWAIIIYLAFWVVFTVFGLIFGR